MGSRISRPSESERIPLVSGPPHLPFDIYLDVLRHISPSSATDRSTLLALTLCCRALRDASQRILFSALSCDHGGDKILSPDDLERVLKVHLKFLRAVVDSPDRLALYVIKYSQHALALDPVLRSSGKANVLVHKKERINLWELTQKALPLMANLRHLYFGVTINHESAPVILSECTFQLESFTWMGIGSEKSLYTTFLPTQRGLLHLDINSASSNDSPALPDGLCPSLMSIACSLSNLVQVSAERPITALHVANSTADIVRPPRADAMEAAEREAYLAALGRIEHLRLWTLPQFQRFTNGITLHRVTMLELRIWQVEDTKLLSQFPALVSLRLWEHYPSEADGAIRWDTARRAFTQCLEMGSVLIGLASAENSGCAWRYSLRHDGSIDEGRILMESRIDSVWWKI